MSRLGRFVKKFELSPTIMFYTLELIERKSFEYKIVDDLEQIRFLFNIERTSVIMCAIVQKYLVSILLTTQSE